MLITKGKVATGEPWKILEVAQGQSPDVLATRLSKELQKMHEGIEALVPMRHNSNGDPEWIVEHIYVRGANGSLKQLVRTPGIDFLRPEIAEGWWIDSLLREEAKPQAGNLGIKTFVRVLTGQCARLCGHITTMEPLTVVIQLKTKRLTLYTCPENLQAVTCPPEHQVFFYQAGIFS